MGNIQIPDKIKELFTKLNDVGLPVPMIRDCLTKEPSLTYTLTLIAAVMVILGTIHATEGLVDYAKAVSLFQLVGGGYLVRQGMKHVAPLNSGDKEDNK
jgi:hypothetical protein